MPEPGGHVLSTEQLKYELLRAEISQIASQHCYQHAARIADDLLGHFDIRFKPLREKKAS